MTDLVERAAKHVAALNGHSDDWERFLEEAEDYVRFIRAEALEEAARVAETTAESDLAYGRRYPDEYSKMEQRAHRAKTIAAAIRALKDKQE